MLPHNSPWTSGLSSIDPPKIDWSLSDWRSHKGEEREAHFPINRITWSPQLTFNGDQQKRCLLFSQEGRQYSAFIPANGRTHPVQVEFLTGCLWIPLDQGRSTLVALHFNNRVLLENDRPVVGKECNEIRSRVSNSWDQLYYWLSNEILKVFFY